jgi:hypothetical protein
MATFSPSELKMARLDYLISHNRKRALPRQVAPGAHPDWIEECAPSFKRRGEFETRPYLS